MTRSSAPDLLALHAVRLQGMADTAAVARRFGLDPDAAEDELLDAEARGWVRRERFAGLGGWSLTASGRVENERLLAAELASAGAEDCVRQVHEAFGPLNARLQRAVTDWQLNPIPGDALAANDHTDWRRDERIMTELRSTVRRVEPLCARLAAEFERFVGYGSRLAAAMDRVDGGDPSWIDRIREDSVHTVWFELHEDLIATLGLQR